jgi:ABC-2 type transport system ATP-binding protein
MKHPAIRFDGVTRRYGTVTAIETLSFDVRAGEMFGLIGPDGAGKTTTIRLTGGLLRPMPERSPSSGATRSPSIAPSPERSGISRSAFSLYGDLTIDENIAFFAEIHGVEQFAAARIACSR